MCMSCWFYSRFASIFLICAVVLCFLATLPFKYPVLEIRWFEPPQTRLEYFFLTHRSKVKGLYTRKLWMPLSLWVRYVLVGNCIYYYQQEDDVYPCGVLFLTGSFVEPLQEGHNERKGFWGIEISRNTESVRTEPVCVGGKVYSYFCLP